MRFQGVDDEAWGSQGHIVAGFGELPGPTFQVVLPAVLAGENWRPLYRYALLNMDHIRGLRQPLDFAIYARACEIARARQPQFELSLADIARISGSKQGPVGQRCAARSSAPASGWRPGWRAAADPGLVRRRLSWRRQLSDPGRSARQPDELTSFPFDTGPSTSRSTRPARDGTNPRACEAADRRLSLRLRGTDPGNLAAACCLGPIFLRGRSAPWCTEPASCRTIDRRGPRDAAVSALAPCNPANLFRDGDLGSRWRGPPLTLDSTGSASGFGRGDVRQGCQTASAGEEA